MSYAKVVHACLAIVVMEINGAIELLSARLVRHVEIDLGLRITRDAKRN